MFDFASQRQDEPRPEPQAARVRARPASEAGAVPDLGEVVRRVRAGLVWVIAAGLAAVVAAVLALPLLTPVYTAQVQILVDPADLRVVENGVNPTAQLADSGVSIVESQVRVIGSDSVLRRVVERLNLRNDPEFAAPAAAEGGFAAAVKRALGLAATEGQAEDPELRAVEALRRKVTVRRPERTFVIEVLVKSRQSSKAAQIANTMTDVYFAEESAARAKAAGRASDALTARLTALRGALQQAENKLAAFREGHDLVETNGRLLADQRLGELNGRLSAAALRTAEAAARADQAREARARGGSSLPEMLQSPELRALRQQLADLQRADAEMNMRLGPRHPAVAEQAAQIRRIEAVIGREKSRIIDSVLKEHERALAAERAVRRDTEALKQETTRNNRDLIGLRDLERTVETQRTIYEAFLRRSRETGEQERIDSTNMRVISPASPPLQRSWPPSPKIVLPGALLLGLGLGALLVAYGPLLLGRGRPRPPQPPLPREAFRSA